MSGYRTILRIEVGLFRFRLYLDLHPKKVILFTVSWCFLYYTFCFMRIRKIAKATISFVISVRLSVRMKQLGSHWTVFMKFDI